MATGKPIASAYFLNTSRQGSPEQNSEKRVTNGDLTPTPLVVGYVIAASPAFD